MFGLGYPRGLMLAFTVIMNLHGSWSICIAINVLFRLH
jgi:hypothetical protein